MSSESLRSEINNLERKVKLLLSEHTQLRAAYQKLSDENQQLRTQVAEYQQNESSFQNQAKISKIVESMIVGENDSEAVKDVIEDYIKEIDKCIAHLGEA